MKVLVVGGGITGLAAARALAARSRERGQPLQAMLVEADDRLGGKIRTVRDGDCLIEAGPDAFISIKPAATRLCQTMGLGDRIVGTDPAHQKTFIVRDGRLLEIPGGMTTFVPTQWLPFIRTPLISWLGKLRMGLDLVVPARANGGDESMADFFTRRLGREAYEWLVEPLLAGIYAGDARALGLAGTFPRYLEMERQSGGLLRATLAARRAPPPPPPKKNGTPQGLFLSLRGGLGELVDAVAAEVRTAGVAIRLGTAVGAIAFQAEAPRVTATLSDGTAWCGDAALLCTPAWAAADLLEARHATLAAALRDIPYVSTATITLGFERRALGLALDGYGFVVPRAEGRPLLACTWTTSKWQGRAPDERALLRTYLGGAGQEDVLRNDDAALAEIALQELQRLMAFRAKPDQVWIHRWPRAMPQYRVGHLDAVSAFEKDAAAVPGLHLAGAAYHGLGVPDCIQDGESAAGRIVP